MMENGGELSLPISSATDRARVVLSSNAIGGTDHVGQGPFRRNPDSR